MNGYVLDIEKATLENTYYRRVLYTTKENQIVLMSIPPGEDIPCEIHHNITQFIRIEAGQGEARIGKNVYNLKDGIALDIPAGAAHQIINTSSVETLKLYSVYSPPEHPDQLIQISKPSLKLKDNKNIKNKIIYLLLL